MLLLSKNVIIPGWMLYTEISCRNSPVRRMCHDVNSTIKHRITHIVLYIYIIGLRWGEWPRTYFPNTRVFLVRLLYKVLNLKACAMLWVRQRSLCYEHTHITAVEVYTGQDYGAASQADTRRAKLQRALRRHSNNRK
jgi:hypothetical protein